MQRSGWGLVAAVGALTSCLSADRPSTPAASSPGPVVARWDGGVLFEREVDDEAARLPPQLKEQLQSTTGRADFVRSVVQKRLLLEEALRRKLDRSPEVVRQVEELERRLAVQALVDEVQRAAPPPAETELRAYFGEHQELFHDPPQSHVARLFLRGNPKDPQLLARLERLRGRLTKGEVPARVCREGDGPERLQGGDVGWVSEASNPEAQAALSLRHRGEVSAPIERQDGVSVLVLLERREAQPARFEDVRARVESRYAAVRQRGTFDALVRQLTAAASVQFQDSSTR